MTLLLGELLMIEGQIEYAYLTHLLDARACTGLLFKSPSFRFNLPLTADPALVRPP